MHKILLTIIFLGSALMACSAHDVPLRSSGDNLSAYVEHFDEQASFLKSLGTFCPPGQAMKGRC
ncbi:MAG: hypothetical protein V4632_24110 [Pseudomonadota bacterium]